MGDDTQVIDDALTVLKDIRREYPWAIQCLRILQGARDDELLLLGHTPETLRNLLKARIGAVIGDSPLKAAV
jgi:hypothetical protein